MQLRENKNPVCVSEVKKVFRDFGVQYLRFMPPQMSGKKFVELMRQGYQTQGRDGAGAVSGVAPAPSAARDPAH